MARVRADRPPADVVVVGLGAAGGLAAARLAHAGLHVVGLEAGVRLEPRAFPPDEIYSDRRNALGAAKVNHELPTVRRRPGPRAVQPRAEGLRLMMNAPGGTKLRSANQSYRLAPWNLAARSRTLARYGADVIPAASTLVDWPFDYQELVPYYDRIEALFGVSGERAPDDDGGPYPSAPLRRSGWNELMADAAVRRGWQPFAAPASIRSSPRNGLPACTYCGHCSGNGCWTQAKETIDLHGLSEAESEGRLELLTAARALRVVTDSSGRATGVEYERDGERRIQPARVVLLASYVYENVRLLLLSRSPVHPAGLGNAHDQVGRHFMTHSMLSVWGLFPGRELNLWSGSAAQATAIVDFDADNFDHEGLGFVGGSVLQAAMELKVFSVLDAVPPREGRWGARWKRWLAEHANSVGSVWMQPEQLPYEDNRLDLDPQVRDPHGLPVVRCTFDLGPSERRLFAFLRQRAAEWLTEAGASETWSSDPAPAGISTHAYGGTRMGDDPTTSVVNRWGMMHEATNVGVLGASCFPTTGGRGPTETVEALAWRTAEHLVAEWDAIA